MSNPKGNIKLPDWVAKGLEPCCPFCGAPATMDFAAAPGKCSFSCVNPYCPVGPATLFASGAVAAARWRHSVEEWQRTIAASGLTAADLDAMADCVRWSIAHRFGCGAPAVIPTEDEARAEMLAFFGLEDKGGFVEIPANDEDWPF